MKTVGKNYLIDEKFVVITFHRLKRFPRLKVSSPSKKYFIFNRKKFWPKLGSGLSFTLKKPFNLHKTNRIIYAAEAYAEPSQTSKT